MCRRFRPTGNRCVSPPPPSIAGVDPGRCRAPGEGDKALDACSTFSLSPRARVHPLPLSFFARTETLTSRFSGYRRRLRPPRAPTTSSTSSPCRPLLSRRRNRREVPYTVAIDPDTAAVPPPPLTPSRASSASPRATNPTAVFLVSSRSSRTL